MASVYGIFDISIPSATVDNGNDGVNASGYRWSMDTAGLFNAAASRAVWITASHPHTKLVTHHLVIRMTVNYVTSSVFGLTCEAFLHGCYTILFAISIYLMVKRARNRISVNKHIFITSVLLYLSCTAHFALEFIHFYTLMISSANFPHLPLLVTVVQKLLGHHLTKSYCDCESNCVGVTLRSELLIYPHFSVISPPFVRPSLAGFILPLCTNLLVTTLIVARIWYLSPSKADDLHGTGRRIPTGTGRAAIDIVVESGMLYLAAQLVFVVLFAIKHPAQAIIAAMAVQIYGIAPVLIIIRVALGLSNTPSEILYSAAGSTSKHAPMQVRIGFSTATSSDGSQRLASEFPVSQTKTEPNGEGPSTRVSTVEDSAPA
ncbi:hypothetical protein BC826DRAFT_965837 [Russula brevipes]|nr:hypothetical protein BC826DRAFT_965837 [Russula brevipes]